MIIAPLALSLPVEGHRNYNVRRQAIAFCHPREPRREPARQRLDPLKFEQYDGANQSAVVGSIASHSLKGIGSPLTRDATRKVRVFRIGRHRFRRTRGRKPGPRTGPQPVNRKSRRPLAAKLQTTSDIRRKSAPGWRASATVRTGCSPRDKRRSQGHHSRSRDKRPVA